MANKIILALFYVIILTGCQNRPRLKFQWHTAKDYRWSELTVDKSTKAGFKKLDPSYTNIAFHNNLPIEDIFKNRNYLNGSGVALGDINGDGWTDIYFARLHGPNKLYENMGGFRFKDITDSAGVAHRGYYSTGVALADMDGDSDLDLLITSMQKKNTLYTNDGQGHFTLKQDSGLEKAKGSMSMALADVDSDGDLDLYVTNYKHKSVLDLFNVNDLSWDKTVKEGYNPKIKQNYTLRPPYDKQYTIINNNNELPDRREIGRRDVLYLNRGDGSFQKANAKKHFLNANGKPAGLKKDFGLTATFHDINQDGQPDLYVCNDYWTKDRIWLNQGKGIFKVMNPLAIRDMSFASMSVDFADINRDGADDFFITEMLSPYHDEKLRQFIPDDPYPNYIGSYRNQPQYNRNSLYLNRGDTTFAETAYFSGIEATGWSWASRFLDVNLDGYEDLLITTGYTYDVQDLDAQKEWRKRISQSTQNHSFIDTYPSLKLPNKAFRNEDGIHFKDVSSQWGFHQKDVSQGLATADLDHDGDLDLVINRLNAKATVYENKAPAPRVAVRLKGKKPNTQAIGTKITLTGAKVRQTEEITAAGEYLSSSDPLIVFAANGDSKKYTLTVTWPDQSQSVINSIKANRMYEIDESTIAKHAVHEHQELQEPVFKDVSAKIGHIHHESPYDDFRIQPLLPLKLSRQGPGVSWVDYDADGDDDLIIPSGRGGRLAIYKNDGGNFTSQTLGKVTRQSNADQTTVLGWRQNHTTILLVGNANYEPGDITFPSAFNYSLQGRNIVKPDSLPGVFSTTGPMAAADYDGDGDIDLFVGGRFVPAHYPMDASSRLFKNEKGRFVLDKVNSDKLKKLGLVSSALFTDYDSDGDQDLLCGLAWGTLKLFRNDEGSFRDVTRAVGLSKYKGWWNGVATGDFNNDGRPDIIATNWGKNSPYQLHSDHSDHSLKMFYQDFNNDGRVNIIESYYNKKKRGYVPRRQWQQYKSIFNIFSTRIQSNKDFAGSSLSEILKINPAKIPSKEINNLESTIFINQGTSFSPQPLPIPAQLTISFDASVADYNNDGNEDIFLSQNFFEVYPNTPRLDAGRGLWLRGNGKGHFDAVPAQKSGIKVYGEQRGAALSDFNADGKVDLAVSQNGAATKLYENQTLNPGITVDLKGPASNADAIGSGIRLLYTDGTTGPRREIQAGSGYWSQNSFRQILGYSKEPKSIKVQWFDGKIDTVAFKPGKMFYSISHDLK